MNLNLAKPLQQDNVFVNAYVDDLEKLTGLPVTQGKRKAVISEGTIVNIVSDKYGFLPNEKFFLEIEEKLIMEDIPYVSRSINRNNKSFQVDYILIDEQKKSIGTSIDEILPMMSFINSYDGTSKTLGTFGLFRKVCTNGLHVAETEIGFSLKHWGSNISIVMPEVGKLIKAFTETEYYKIEQKFHTLSETRIFNVEDFVNKVCKETNIFQFETSEKNPAPSYKANEVINTINRECSQLSVQPNMWLGYNAFNELIHKMNFRNFEVRNKKDNEIFESILSF